jgi:hypothetical protein
MALRPRPSRGFCCDCIRCDALGKLRGLLLPDNSSAAPRAAKALLRGRHHSTAPSTCAHLLDLRPARRQARQYTTPATATGGAGAPSAVAGDGLARPGSLAVPSLRRRRQGVKRVPPPSLSSLDECQAGAPMSNAKVWFTSLRSRQPSRPCTARRSSRHRRPQWSSS